MTDHQAAAIRTLRQHGTMSGRSLRTEIAAERKLSVTGFYRMMADLEDAGFVVGRYDNPVLDGEAIRRRMYHLPHFETVPK